MGGFGCECAGGGGLVGVVGWCGVEVGGGARKRPIDFGVYRE